MTKQYPNRVAEVRKRTGFTQQKLADAIGAHWITVSKIERGKMKLTHEWASKISTAMNVDIFDIYEKEYSNRLIDIAGMIVETGRMKLLSDKESNFRYFRVDVSFENNEKAFWLYINTDYFFPLLKNGDIVRLDRLEIDAKLSNNKIYYVEYRLESDKQSSSGFGLILSGQKHGRFDYVPVSGAPVSNVELVSVSMMVITLHASPWAAAGGAKLERSKARSSTEAS